MIIFIIVVATAIEFGLSLIIKQFINPPFIHMNTNMNQPSCYISFILLSIISPVFFLAKMLYIITHIGRIGYKNQFFIR